MITFKDFILTEEFTLENNDIKTDCTNFLNYSRGLPAFRGVSNFPKDKIMFLMHPKDRQAMNSSKDNLFLFNGIIGAGFNIDDIKSHSLFISGEEKKTKMYGTTCYCFPAGDINWVWSSIISDSFIYNYTILIRLSRILDISDVKTDTLIKKLADTFTTASDFLDKNKVNENTITFNKVIELLDLPNTLSYKTFRNALMSTGLRLYRSDNLHDALKSGHEILLHETHGYYLVPVELVNSYRKNNHIDMSKYNNSLYNLLLDKIHENK